MPIQFRHDINPLVSGAMSWLGGYGQGQQQRSGQMLQENQQNRQIAAQQSLQSTGALFSMAEAGMQQGYRVQLADQANTHAIQQLTTRGGIEGLHSANQEFFRQTGSFLVAPDGAPPETPTFATMKQPGETIDAFVNRRSIEMSTNRYADRMMEQGFEHSLTEDQQSQQQGYTEAIANLPSRVAQNEISPEQAESLRQDYTTQLSSIQPSWHPRKPGPESQISDVPGAPGWKMAPSRSGPRLYNTNPKPAGKGAGGADASDDLQYVPPTVANNPVAIQQWRASGRPVQDETGTTVGHLDNKGNFKADPGASKVPSLGDFARVRAEVTKSLVKNGGLDFEDVQPTPEEIDAGVRDTLDAYERVVHPPKADHRQAMSIPRTSDGAPDMESLVPNQVYAAPTKDGRATIYARYLGNGRWMDLGGAE